MRENDGPNIAIGADKSEKRMLRPPRNDSLEIRKVLDSMKALQKNGEPKEALAFFEQCSEPNDVLYDAALNICKQALWYKEAMALWERMPVEWRSVVSYTTMIGLCSKVRRFQEAEEYMREMQAKGIEANLITYSSMLHVYARSGQPDAALILLQRIPAALLDTASVDSKQTVYQCAMMASAWAGDYAGTYNVFMTMSGAGTPPNHAHFNALLVACAKSCDEKTAQGVFDTMKQWQLQPRVADYTTLIACTRRNLPRCKSLFTELKEAGLRPGGMTYQAMLQAHLLAQDGLGARAIYDEASGWDLSSRRMQELVAEMQDLLRRQAPAAAQ